jgi:hypothetical protein
LERKSCTPLPKSKEKKMSEEIKKFKKKNVQIRLIVHEVQLCSGVDYSLQYQKVTELKRKGAETIACMTSIYN